MWAVTRWAQTRRPSYKLYLRICRYSAIRLILIYRPSEGGRLSRSTRCSKGVQSVPKVVYRCGFCEKHRPSRQRVFDHGTYRAAGKLEQDHCDLGYVLAAGSDLNPIGPCSVKMWGPRPHINFLTLMYKNIR